jgi:hypothetical protein
MGIAGDGESQISKTLIHDVDEERPIGNVKWQTYKLYIRAATYITWALTITILRESACSAER